MCACKRDGARQVLTGVDMMVSVALCSSDKWYQHTDGLRHNNPDIRCKEDKYAGESLVCSGTASHSWVAPHLLPMKDSRLASP